MADAAPDAAGDQAPTANGEAAGPSEGERRGPRPWRSHGCTRGLLHAAEQRRASLAPRDYAEILHRLQRLDRGKAPRLGVEPLFEGLLRDLGSTSVTAWPPRDVAIATYALARLQSPQPEFLASVAAWLPENLPRCSPQDVSNVAWAFGRLEVREDGMLQAISAHVAAEAGGGRLGVFSPQAIGNIVHACGLLRFRDDGMLRAVASDLPTRIREYSHQNISNVLLGFAWLDYRDAATMQGVAALLAGRRGLGDFTPQATCNTLYAFTHLGVGGRGTLVRAVSERLAASPAALRAFAPRDLVALASVCCMPLVQVTVSMLGRARWAGSGGRATPPRPARVGGEEK